MTRKVQGYLTEDDKFFTSLAEAELYDTTSKLEAQLTARNVKVKQFMQLLYELGPFIMAWYHASAYAKEDASYDSAADSERTVEATRQEQGEKGTGIPRFNPADDGRPEDEPDAILDVSTGSDEPMSDIRDRPQPSPVQSVQPGTPVRSRLHYARSVQRHQTMATPQHDGPTRTREVQWRTPIREAT